LGLPFASGAGAPRRIAILGDAAGTVARAYGHYFPSTRVDAVELDGELTHIGREYFHLGGPELHTYTADARPWLRASRARYDSIFLDAYRQPYIPFYLLTNEFFTNVRAHLNPAGTFIINVGHLPGSNALEQVVTATLRSVFAHVVRDRFSPDNSLVMASQRPLSAAPILRAAVGTAPELEGAMVATARSLGPALSGGSVYTDDLSPVEWLTDLSIIRYATGSR
jgi:spermidine synthase